MKIYTKKEKKILNIITEHCFNCPARTNCHEEHCTLYRIEKVITEEKNVDNPKASLTICHRR